MTSNTLRYFMAGAMLALAILGILKVITPAQAHALTAAVLSAYAIAQGQLTPATNAGTPDNLPAKPPAP